MNNLSINVIDEGSRYRSNSSTKVIEPIADGMWLATNVGGWHSGGLIISEEGI